MKIINKNSAVVLLLTLLLTTRYYGQNKLPEDKEETFGIAFIKTMFSNVALNDASAAIKVYISELQKNFAKGYAVRPVLYENCDELIKSFSKENIAIINLTSVDYLLYKSRLPVIPIVVSSSKNSPFEEYILLVKKDSNINSLSELPDKKIGMLPKLSNPVPHMWLEVLLAENKIASIDKIVSRISEGKAESQIIMSVFFGQLNACLVSKRAFIVMSELNPQIGLQLKILAASPGYMLGLSCFTKNINNSPFRSSLYDGSLKAASFPAGQQLFTLMKVDKVIPFKEEYLNSVRKLLRDYNSLQKKHKK